MCLSLLLAFLLQVQSAWSRATSATDSLFAGVSGCREDMQAVHSKVQQLAMFPLAVGEQEAEDLTLHLQRKAKLVQVSSC
jgi:hypothetical protein